VNLAQHRRVKDYWQFVPIVKNEGNPELIRYNSQESSPLLFSKPD